MKLVEILAKGLEKWPDHTGAAGISQDESRVLNRLDRGVEIANAAKCPPDVATWPSSTWTRFSLFEPAELATDHATAIVTRSDWKAERAKLKAAKANELGKFDALAIRDRIRELDTKRAEVESTYQRQISEITQERELLVQKLAGEGLALVEVVVQPVEEWPEGAPDRNSAPEWATHIGRDVCGFHWFDHSPEKFGKSSKFFLKGCLGMNGYRNGRWEEAVKIENELPLWSSAI